MAGSSMSFLPFNPENRSLKSEAVDLTQQVRIGGCISVFGEVLQRRGRFAPSTFGRRGPWRIGQ